MLFRSAEAARVGQSVALEEDDGEIPRESQRESGEDGICFSSRVCACAESRERKCDEGRRAKWTKDETDQGAADYGTLLFFLDSTKYARAL